MRQENRYESLNTLGILMVVDAGCMIVNNIVNFATLTLFQNGRNYIDLTLRLIQFTVWSMIISVLTRLGRQEPGFLKARVYYMIRIFAFGILRVFNAAIEITIYSIDDLRHSEIWPSLFFCLVISILTDCLPPALGARCILRSGAEMLCDMGKSDEAEKCRRCGNRFVYVASVNSILDFVFLPLLFILLAVIKEQLVFALDDVAFLLLILIICAVILVTFATEIWSLVLWLQSARRVRNIYRTARELME